MKCLDEERLFALVEGAASEKDAKVWQAHVDGCERCRKSLKTMKDAIEAIAEEEPLDVNAHADAVVASLDRAPVKRQRLLVPLAMSGLALAAALLLGVGIGRNTKPNDDPGEFTPRGSAAGPSLHRDVAVDVLRRDEGGFTRVRENDEITVNTAFTAEVRNVGSTTASALVFIIDARAEVRWLFPQYIETGDNPSAVEIAPAKQPMTLSNGVMLPEMAPGSASLVTMLTRTRMKVSEIEAVKNVSPDRLRHEFPDADVRVLPIRVAP